MTLKSFKLFLFLKSEVYVKLPGSVTTFFLSIERSMDKLS